MTSDTWLLVLAVALWLGVVVFWGWWIRGQLQRRKRVRTWPRVSALVTTTSSTVERVAADGPSPQYRIWQVGYEFTDPTGRTQTGEHRSRTALTEGDRLEVVHDPDDPSTHEPVARTGALWAAVTLQVFFTLGVLLVSVFPLAFALDW